GDLIEDSNLYDELQNIDEYDWNDNNDIEINGNKYRRMKKSDAYPKNGGGTYLYNWPDEDTYHYFKYEPIKWRVLKADGNQAFLLADIVLDNKNYFNKSIPTGGYDITWKTSTIRSWLNGYSKSSNDAKLDYTDKSFIGSAFSSAESSAIMDTPVINVDNISKGTEGGEDTIDKIFFLSESECYGDDAIPHGFLASGGNRDEARSSNSSTYAKAMGWECLVYPDINIIGKGSWWLRSPGASSGRAAYVDHRAMVITAGLSVFYGYVGVRPALNLDLSSDIYSYAGTVCSDGTENEVSPGGQTEPGEEYIPVTDISLSENKLQLKVGDKSKIAASVFPDN
ncbi:hypothetical protein C818_01673, partial [Lachnospiraceae bacterium MD308]